VKEFPRMLHAVPRPAVAGDAVQWYSRINSRRVGGRVALANVDVEVQLPGGAPAVFKHAFAVSGAAAQEGDSGAAVVSTDADGNFRFAGMLFAKAADGSGLVYCVHAVDIFGEATLQGTPPSDLLR
jgi:hypothetical protein